MGSYEGQTPLVEFEWWSSGAAVAFQFRKNLPLDFPHFSMRGEGRREKTSK